MTDCGYYETLVYIYVTDVKNCMNVKVKTVMVVGRIR